MAIHLSSPVSDLPGIGGIAVKDLRNLGIKSAQDLLLYLPYRYDDFSVCKAVAELQAGDTVTVCGIVKTIKTRPSFKRQRMKLTEAIVEDNTGAIKVVWFNQPYLENTLKAGSRVSLAGTVDAKYGLALVNPIYEPDSPETTHTGRIVPVYGLAGSLTMRKLRSAIKVSLSAADELIEWIPEQIINSEKYQSRAEVIKNIHFPDSQEHLKKSVEQIKFRELFLHQMMFAQLRLEKDEKVAQPIACDLQCVNTLIQSLPFSLTNAQERAIQETLDDLARAHPMNRLLEGDVGSGKTVVAVVAIHQVLSAKHKCAYLAPTEILARQQHTSIVKLIPNEKIGLLTSAQVKIGNEQCKREDLFEAINSGHVKCVVGTHALLQDDAMIDNLALVVIDEQHRFGVEQRHALLNAEGKLAPHLLSMTATPIPRSLALTLYGDLDLSIIDEMPKGRKPIRTFLVNDKLKKRMWEKVLEQIKQGRQAYVVCPLIDPSDKLGIKSVTEAAQALKKSILKNYQVGVLHGKLKSDEKEKTMQEFVVGKTDVLVTTTVVEVGVDVPNATVMMIVGAERFGLAQLHQLRGRVGRSDM
ncbi:MAG: ATP-dependent DNA helicase RecG, partial [Patescibacteria group bacterium]